MVLGTTHQVDKMEPFSRGMGPPNIMDTLKPVKHAMVWRTSSRYEGSSSIVLHSHKNKDIYISDPKETFSPLILLWCAHRIVVSVILSWNILSFGYCCCNLCFGLHVLSFPQLLCHQ